MLRIWRASLERLKSRLLARIKDELAASGVDTNTVSAKVAEAEKAIGDGTILEWLVDNLPTIIAELVPFIQAILALLAILK